jgi:hypothetical protein
MNILNECLRGVIIWVAINFQHFYRNETNMVIFKYMLNFVIYKSVVFKGFCCIYKLWQTTWIVSLNLYHFSKGYNKDEEEIYIYFADIELGVFDILKIILYFIQLTFNFELITFYHLLHLECNVLNFYDLP